MNIAFKRRNSTNRREITHSFRQNRVNDCDLRAAELALKLKAPCTTFGVQNAIKIAFKRRNSSNKRERTLSFPQNRVKRYDLVAAVPVSTPITACTTFGV